MIEQVVHKLLSEAESISGASINIHYGERPQKYPLPAVVIQRGRANHRHTLKGASGKVNGSVRVTVLAGSYLAPDALKEKVRLCLDGYAGTVAIKDEDGQEQTVTIKSLKLLDDDDIPSDHRDGEGKIRTHGIQMDFDYSANESIPTFT